MLEVELAEPAALIADPHRRDATMRLLCLEVNELRLTFGSLWFTAQTTQNVEL